MKIEPLVSDSRMSAKNTKTLMIVKFLVAICFIPISIRDQRIKWSFFSWRNIVHIFVYPGYVVAMLISLHIKNSQPFSASNENPIELIASYLSNICDLQVLCPLLISSKET